MEKTMRVVAIDDDPTQLTLTGVMCGAIPYPAVTLHTFERADAAYELLEREAVDLVITDYRLPDSSGLDVLQRVKRINPLVPVVILTAYESTQEALELIKNGADDYLVKPLRRNDLEHLLVRIAESQALRRETTILQSEVNEHFESEFIVYNSNEMAEVLSIAARSAASSATVLIRGDSGTGKELIAHLIHNSSERKARPFVTVNVAALPETLVESELFGHRKGSFTGAASDRTGRFEEADGGTLFIDEVGDISPGVQVKLLRAIQFGQIQRVGDNASVELDVRIIAATSRNLEDMIRDNSFRADLFYRLNVVAIHLPALRDRKTDIGPLVSRFIQRFSARNKKEVTSISHEALDRLMKYDYPGNVRELENIVERAIILARGSIILERDLPAEVRKETAAAPPREDGPQNGKQAGDRGKPGGDDLPAHAAQTGSLWLPGPQTAMERLPPDGYDEAIRDYERALLLRALAETQGNQSAAARLLGIGERKLRSRMDALGVENTFRA